MSEEEDVPLYTDSSSSFSSYVPSTTESYEEQDEGVSIPTATPLSWATKICYSLIAIVDAGPLIIGFYLTAFLLEVVQLNPASTGLLFLMGQLADGISTPIIGKVSDNTRTRLGRRRPWIIGGAFPYVLFYILLWSTWLNTTNQSILMAFYCCIYLLLTVSHNLLSVSHMALMPDLVETYNQACDLSSWRTILSVLFSIVCMVVQSMLTESFFFTNQTTNISVVDYEVGYGISSYAIGGFFFLVIVICGSLLKEKKLTSEQQKSSQQEGLYNNVIDLLSTFKSRSYVCIVLSYVFSWTTVQFIQSNLLLHTKYVSKKEPYFTYLILGVLGCAAVGGFFYSKVSLVFGKKYTLLLSTFVWILVLIAIFWIDSSTPLWVLIIVACFCGTSVGATMTLPLSMIPDIVDEDECLNGIRREGAFFSIYILTQKIGSAIALAMSSWILGLAGYVPPEDDKNSAQPYGVILVLRLFLSFVPILLLLISAIPLAFYQIDKEIAEANIKKLKVKLFADKLKKKMSNSYENS